MKKQLEPAQIQELISTLQTRFEKHKNRHVGIEWSLVQAKLESAQSAAKLWSLHQMESTEGEPDVIGFDEKTGEYLFCDCAAESPKGRRSLCYDQAALDSRKENKPQGNAKSTAEAMGIELLDETQYRALQQLDKFDTKTSSWLETPAPIRKLGGAIFGDWRYGQVFIYHNGAESYYAARGFRGLLRV